MRKTRKKNQGFSLIELLIAVAILSIVMVMIVQFMGTSTAAYRKTKKNLNIQTEAMKTVEQLSDTLMRAQYVRISTKDGGMYTITKDTSSGKEERKIEIATDSMGNAMTSVDYDFVPDNFGNYCDDWTFDGTDRKVIVNFDDYTLVDYDTSKTYPLTSDHDYPSGSKVRSYRALKATGDYHYIKPQFIYAEYYSDELDADGKQQVEHVLYYITDMTDSEDKTCSMYMCRYTTPVSNSTNYGLSTKKSVLVNSVGAMLTTKEAANADAFTTRSCTSINEDAPGLVTDKIKDFYISADVEGNAFLTDILFMDGKYEYNTIETINLRNSNVLTVRPQNLFKLKGTGSAGNTTTSSGAGSTGGAAGGSGTSGTVTK